MLAGEIERVEMPPRRRRRRVLRDNNPALLDCGRRGEDGEEGECGGGVVSDMFIVLAAIGLAKARQPRGSSYGSASPERDVQQNFAERGLNFLI